MFAVASLITCPSTPSGNTTARRQCCTCLTAGRETQQVIIVRPPASSNTTSAVDQQAGAVRRAGLQIEAAGKSSYQLFLTGFSCSTLCQRTAILRCCYVHSYQLALQTKLTQGVKSDSVHLWCVLEGRYLTGSSRPLYSKKGEGCACHSCPADSARAAERRHLFYKSKQVGTVTISAQHRIGLPPSTARAGLCSTQQ